MSASNYPPGVTGNEPEIIGDPAWEAVHETLDNDATFEGMTATDAREAWAMGFAAWKVAREAREAREHLR